MAPDGSISDQYGWDDAVGEAGPLIGLTREEARAGVVAWFDERGLLEDVRDHPHSVGHSYRSHVPIEPYLSDQWYVAVTDDRLRGEALRAMAPDQRPDAMPEGIAAAGDHAGDGALRFLPDRYARTYRGVAREPPRLVHQRASSGGATASPCGPAPFRAPTSPPRWPRRCSVPSSMRRSRSPGRPASQRGGAHVARRLPDDMVDESVCVPAQVTLDLAGLNQSEADVIAALEADGFAQDPDVLDTWFSSALWPLSTMGWPDPDRFDAEFDTAGTARRVHVPTLGADAPPATS